MSKFAIRLLTLAMFSMALVAAPLVTKVHANPDSDAPPPSSSKKEKEEDQRSLSSCSRLNPRLHNRNGPSEDGH